MSLTECTGKEKIVQQTRGKGLQHPQINQTNTQQNHFDADVVSPVGYKEVNNADINFTVCTTTVLLLIFTGLVWTVRCVPLLVKTGRQAKLLVVKVSIWHGRNQTADVSKEVKVPNIL